MSSDSVERQLYVPVLQRRSHAATTLSNCVPVLQRSLHAASYVSVQRHCAIALVPRHFSMSSIFFVPTMCTDITVPVVQRRYHAATFVVGRSTCSSSAETFTSRPTSAHTLYIIHVPVCSATYMLHRRALHPAAYETFASAVTLYQYGSSIYLRSCRNFLAYETVHLLRRVCHPAYAPTSSRVLPARPTTFSIYVVLYVVRVLCTN